MKNYNRIVVSIYIHPDFYPPTINAINNLAEHCNELIVVTRNNCKEDYFIGDNIKFIKIGAFIRPYDFEKKNVLVKINTFIKFSFQVLKNSYNADWLVSYDAIPLLSFYLIHWFLPKKISTWYHNHDVPEIKSNSKFSIGWFAAKFEHKALSKMNYFTLPSNDRLAYYPKLNTLTKYSLIPNYPSLKIYNSYNFKEINKTQKVKILYQGSIGKGHSLEEIVTILSKSNLSYDFNLVLKGAVREQYKNELEKIAINSNVKEKVEWLGLGLYKDLQAITKSAHIGIAIYMGNDIMNKTLGTASNKIYEYAACGLPILVYDNEQFRKYLGKYEWAIFTDGTVENLKSSLIYIIENYEKLSKNARLSFETTFNYEKYFKMPNTISK